MTGDAVIQPFVDPQAIAASALLAADFMSQPKWAKQVETLGRAGGSAQAGAKEVTALARGMLQLLASLGGVWVREQDTAVVDVLAQQGVSLRKKMVDDIEVRMHDLDDARLWLESVRLSRGHVDLLLDLRALAALYRSHAEDLTMGPESRFRMNAARCANALEAALVGDEPQEARDARRWLAKAWTLLVREYGDMCRVGRFLGDERYAGGAFPSLPAISRARRRERAGAMERQSKAPGPLPPRSGVTDPPTSGVARRPVEGPPSAPRAPLVPASAIAPVSVPPSRPRPPPPESARGPRPPLPPPNPPLQRLAPPKDAVVAPPASLDPFPFAPAAPAPSKAPAPASLPDPFRVAPAAPSTAPADRRDDRRIVELEVGITSESNLYLGFAENLSDGGLFVATYAPMPIGAMVDLRLSLPTSPAPLNVRGEVRWIRERPDADGGWPGMGIRFAGLTPSDEAALQAFLRQRAPIFFVE